MTPATRARLQELVKQWRTVADDMDADGDFCCALVRRHDADAIAACLAAEGERPEKCDHKFIDSTRCLKCGWLPPVASPASPEGE